MDYYNFDSEVIESLNLLRPPVKRASGYANRDFSVYCSKNKNNLKVLKEFGHKFKSKCTNNKNDLQPSPTKHGNSSTSLILKKTSESQILKQYSVVYTDLHCQKKTTYTQPKTPITQDKPLIKVTVIPKSDQNAGSKLFRKQRIVTKTIQATTSNCENSIHTKNVYLVVAGRKKDKIYEIKTTGSVNFEKESNKDDALENLSHFKEVIKTLNMERKKKKNKKREAKKNETQINICETTRNINHTCKCSPTPTGSEASVHEVRPGRSRVRIFGKIGVTADDNYVLKCQATVDDKPVLPSALKKKSSTCSIVVCSKNAETSTNRRTNDPLSGREELRKREEEAARFRRSSVVYGREEFENTREERWRRSSDAARLRDEIEPEENQMLWRNTGVLCLRGDSDQDLRAQPTRTDGLCEEEEESDDDDADAPFRDSRDVLMQTEVRSNALNDLLINIQRKNSTRISNQSQATQVNFNKIDDVCNIDPFSSNKTVTRCICGSQCGPSIDAVDHSQDCSETLKPCQSPLVIISVYPKQDHNKLDIIQTVQCAHLKSKPLMVNYPEAKAESMAEMTVNKTTHIDPWFRTPSPNGTKMKSKVSKFVETRHTKSSSRNEIPKVGKKHSRKSTSPPKQQEFVSSKQQEFVSSRTGGPEKRKKSSPPRSPRAKSPSPSNRESQNKNASRQSLKAKSKKPKKVDASMNTEHQKTKKALVDSYTTKITEHIMKGNKEGPIKSLSTVSINIDSEHEYYDVTFRQDNLTTDLNVRKTMKEACVQNVYETADSLKNFLPRASKNKKNGKQKKYLNENQTDDFNKDTTILAVRDSLEIGHRREGKVIRDTQTRRSKQPPLNTNDREFFAPIKHFTGDNCTICDPMERDREIRELLGVDERRNQSQFNSSQERVVALENILSRRCFYNKQCEKSYITGFALSQSFTPCACTSDKQCEDVNCEDSDYKLHDDDGSVEDEEASPTKPEQKGKAKSKKQTELKDKSSEDVADKQDRWKPRNFFGTLSKKIGTSKHKVTPDKTTKNVSCECIIISEDLCPCSNSTNKCNIPTCGMSKTQKNETGSSHNVNKDKQSENETDSSQNINKHEKKESDSSEDNIKNKQNSQDVPKTSKVDKKGADFSQNINVNKQNSQQDLKGTKVDFSQNISKNKENSQGGAKTTKADVERVKTSAIKEGDDPNVASLYQQLTLNRNIQIFLQVEQFSKQKPIVLSKKQYKKIKRTIQRTVFTGDKSKQRCVCNKSAVSLNPKNELDKKHPSKEGKSGKSKGSKKSKKNSPKKGDKNPVDTVVLFSNETCTSFKDTNPLKVIVQRAASSLEFRNSSISYWKHVTFSSTNIGSIGSSSIANRNQNSVETIFRGHKKSMTPNLGTSAFSLLSEARISESQSMKLPPDPKAKKPFLKRLMSCLVLRTRVSDRIPNPEKCPMNVNSSVNSYDIGSSFGAIEMSSSIYDTSVSFYSDHSIHPLSSKFKRSFLSSVRGFLTSRKS